MRKKSFSRPENRMLFAFLLNFLFAVIEVIGGLLTGSVTIMSDAIHDFCDSFALFLAFFCEKISLRKPDRKYPFGYRRFSVLSGLANNLLLAGCSIFIIWNSIRLSFLPRSVNGGGMFLFAIFGILVNGAAMLLTSKGKNVNVKTVSIHMLEDVLTWFSVLVVGLIMFFLPVPALDTILSVVIAVVVLLSALKNLVDIFFLLSMRSVRINNWDEFLEIVKTETAPIKFHVFSFSPDGEEKIVILVFDTDMESSQEWKRKEKVLREQAETFGITGLLILKKTEENIAKKGVQW